MLGSEIEFVNEEHQQIYGQTKEIPGWQAPGDTERLYEMAFKAGEVILEIGTFAGRSAVVELRGSLANKQRQSTPMYFGVDINLIGVMRTMASLEDQDLLEHALVYHGDLNKFVAEIDIQPTMVFVDGDHRYDGIKSDLEILKDYLAPETPVLCHDYTNPQNDSGALGVRRAVDEFVAEGWAKKIGVNGCSVLLVTTDKCRSAQREAWSKHQFSQKKTDLIWSYCKPFYRIFERTDQRLKTIQARMENQQSVA